MKETVGEEMSQTEGGILLDERASVVLTTSDLSHLNVQNIQTALKYDLNYPVLLLPSLRRYQMTAKMNPLSLIQKHLCISSNECLNSTS